MELNVIEPHSTANLVESMQLHPTPSLHATCQDPLRQCTLKKAIKATGVALHSGQISTITLRPAPVHTGIVFRRVDLCPIVAIRACAEAVGDTKLQTTLLQDNTRIGTIEHLMSALAGLNIDNVYIDVSTSELPIMDGSAGPFVFLIQSAGIEEQDAVKRFIRIKKSICVSEGDRWACLEPFDGFQIACEIDFNHPLFRQHCQKVNLELSSTTYIKEIGRARTFGFMSDYQRLRTMRLAQGGSLDNAIVMDESSVLNQGGLRYKDEFVRHKILDAIGDLYVLGHNIIGAFRSYKTGHHLNNQLLRALLAATDTWEYVEFTQATQAPTAYQRKSHWAEIFD